MKGEETAILVESKLRLGVQIAVVEIAGERVMAFARPFDRAPDPFRLPGQRARNSGTGAVADAEIAADNHALG